MSTFNGIVKEFPNIRIDYFRAGHALPKPDALFLSHVHSDHLMGLESVRMPFVYCSATTKRLLLKLEKYPHRINFAKGILESRKQHYKALKTVLRALPLQTAVELELTPKSKIQVTLFDANHCPGAVMFLIEGDGKAVLYTGDVRAESWWLNSLVQNPKVVPYTSGFKYLDCLYLDTTFASHEEPYREFQSRREGLVELIKKVSLCPSDTVFYFRAWTLGYEDVWLTLSNLLQSKVHVDEYQVRLFRSIVEGGGDGYSTFEGPSLAGYVVGNKAVEGCLTLDRSVRIHSCEPGSECHTAIKSHKNVVWITPIVSRLRDGTEVRELGAGGGGGDLYRTSELQLDDLDSLQAFAKMCRESIRDREMSTKVQRDLAQADRSLRYRMPLEGVTIDDDSELTIEQFIRILSSGKKGPGDSDQIPLDVETGRPTQDIRNTITFPYSRHSSYTELRQFVSTFQPRDICPCTVDIESWTTDMSIEALFGELCSDRTFYYDQVVSEAVDDARQLEADVNSRKRKRRQAESQRTETEDEDYDVFESVPNDLTVLDKAGSNDLEVAVRTTPCNSIGITSQPDLANIGSEQNNPHSGPTVEFLEVQRAFLSANHMKSSIDADTQDFFELPANELGLPLDAFRSQSEDENEDDLTHSISTPSPNDTPKLVTGAKKRGQNSAETRRRRRVEAFVAARHSLRENDPTLWNDLNIRSIGQTEHTLQEMLL